MNFTHVSMYLADANWGTQHKDKINNEINTIMNNTEIKKNEL